MGATLRSPGAPPNVLDAVARKLNYHGHRTPVGRFGSFTPFVS
jgi:hypothetical protein